MSELHSNHSTFIDRNPKKGPRRLLIAGTGSGTGKTTVTLGLMRALTRRGWKVQPFKCGPDYIDPTYHTAVCGVSSRNLDEWMCGAEAMRSTFFRHSAAADIALIEGVMGMYDGRRADSEEGSAASIAKHLDCPVLLVIDASGMGRSAAAIVLGFQQLDPEVRLAGVIANRVGSEGHGKLIREAVEQVCGVPLVGYVLREDGLQVPERHLGLVPAVERGGLETLFDRMADAVEAHTDMEALLRIAAVGAAEREETAKGGETMEPPDAAPLSAKEAAAAGGAGTEAPIAGAERRLRLALAYDAAFHFYYADNLEMLEEAGFELVRFSPLLDEPVPEDADGLYIGGGFPEAFAEQLARCGRTLGSIREAVEAGMPTFAECGGYMLLMDRLVTVDGEVCPLAGLLPGETRMGTKLAALGYREVSGTDGNFLLRGGTARGHEFHYSTIEEPKAGPKQAYPPAYLSRGRAGEKPEGAVHPAGLPLVAGYTHLHFASNPEIVANWREACVAFRQKRI
ncbi:cobyrinate a,c-diamide synthase [Paenibacillus melissococcoides]|uniref:Cobyrinate a,c-diamide synthase n=1 Tax=Paenibacillus melissococcoides TaxID=2912268 RepID=A0ABM9G0E9_9BACL|nr:MULTISPECIES: cobyrinate a,c-diamide synthase [Paenibacillus]GIO78316.1 cobyrinic acid a,c-diamide synthase [Paenibacillus dendritiformis]CAH8245002.1 cobyrinate a,c-diamide synthase [Paenibacillus melissococcoides]CAH8709610.1 cobyrinate a,c-diamide synthase [Paenibacillus melissococcoides]CAH8710336.1 cobyrinate a,c-diamide synthase [Paenibacillus melissococcoides]